ncbi:DUF6090 family protein [Winogradskyella maritima]|uniref:DUF6090 family protein n=1 Tax=Winogradskyella maritima TaxID=1517766 RepID=A0ABV8AGU4_9FLAO|nr:DUF6090 family protein [Winogradskyella maritima]
MSENRTGKYFKYAIGEIILVVIGILIALQINNLNERHKANIQEQEYYCMLLQNIEQDKAQITQLKILVQKRFEASFELIREIQKEKPETVLFAKKWFPAFQSSTTFKPDDAAYSDIKSSGNLKLIKDKTITNALNLYFKNVNGHSEAILSNRKSLDSKIHSLQTYFEAGFYQAYFEDNNKNFPEDIVLKVKADLPKYISDNYKSKLYDIALFLGTATQRLSEILLLIEKEVDTIKEILERKCKKQ